MDKEPLQQLKSYSVSVLLVDDQPIIAEAIRFMLQNEPSILFHYCQDPGDAIQMAKEVKPTVILQDLVMPDIDGLALLRYYQADPEICQIPVVILSTKEESVTKADAFALGAADYIVKLPDQIEFLARVKHHSEAYIRLLERNDVYEKLVESQSLLNNDLKNAASYVRSLLPHPLDGDVETSWRFIPSAQLGGDAFSYHWLDEDHLAFYLLDVCGHGVGAALLSISISNVVYSQSLLNTDFKNPALVLANLNEAFPMEKHNNMFFTMWYGVYNRKSKKIKYSSAGHPPALVYNLESLEKEPIKLKTEGIVLGAMANTLYINQEYALPQKNKLFLYSDGVYELFNEKHEALTIEDFIPTLTQFVLNKPDNLDELVKLAQELQGGKQAFSDDFSVVEMKFK